MGISGQMRGVSAVDIYATDASGNVVGLVLPNGSIAPTIFVLGQQNAAVSGAADTNENTLYSLTVPAGLMGVNDSLRVTLRMTITNNANSKTLALKFGTLTSSTSASVTNSAGIRGVCTISNRNAANAQICDPSVGAVFTNVAGITGTVDTTQAQTLSITVTKTVAGDTMRLESVLVELIRAA